MTGTTGEHSSLIFLAVSKKAQRRAVPISAPPPVPPGSYPEESRLQMQLITISGLTVIHSPDPSSGKLLT